MSDYILIYNTFGGNYYRVDYFILRIISIYYSNLYIELTKRNVYLYYNCNIILYCPQYFLRIEITLAIRCTLKIDYRNPHFINQLNKSTRYKSFTLLL